jgi:hypothetical protein
MLALTTDRLDPAIVRTLLRHGADTTIKSARGETALDWAHKYGRQDVVAALGGAPPPSARPRETSTTASSPALATAVERSVRLLERPSADFVPKGGCVACHAQPAAEFAVSGARVKGIAIDEQARADRLRQMTLPGPVMMERRGGGGDGLLYFVEGCCDADTDRMRRRTTTRPKLRPNSRPMAPGIPRVAQRPFR